MFLRICHPEKNYSLRIAVGEVKTFALQSRFNTFAMSDEDRRIVHCFQNDEGLRITGLRVGTVVLKAMNSETTLTIIVHEKPISDRMDIEQNNGEPVYAIAA